GIIISTWKWLDRAGSARPSDAGKSSNNQQELRLANKSHQQDDQRQQGESRRHLLQKWYLCRSKVSALLRDPARSFRRYQAAVHSILMPKEVLRRIQCRSAGRKMPTH